MNDPNQAVFGISCYKQVAADECLREQDSEVTRNSVQKSVCVLTSLPLYGVLKVNIVIIMALFSLFLQMIHILGQIRGYHPILF